MKKAAEGLKKAIDAGVPDDVFKAATKLNAACMDCHTTFRDGH
jgi:cytochrome c556